MTQRHEPIFNVPPVVVATVVVLLLVHALRMWVFTEAQDTQFLLIFAFIPARYDAGLVGSFPGGFGAELWTFFTYAFIHADLAAYRSQSGMAVAVWHSAGASLRRLCAIPPSCW